MFSLSWLISLTVAWGALAQPTTAQFSVLMGPTNGSEFEFAVLHQKIESLAFQIRLHPSGKIIEPAKVRMAQREFSPWGVSHVYFTEVPKDQSASLLLLNKTGSLIEERPLRVWNEQRTSYQVAVVSCAAGYLYEQEMWQRLNSLQLDAVIFGGDNIYGDRPNAITKRPADPKQLWELYVDARSKYDFYFRNELVPAMATWDDHDFGTDNGDKNYRYAAESRQIFFDFFAQSNRVNGEIQNGPGIAMRWSANPVNFILLDNRSFRTPMSESLATSWGEAQKAWLDQVLDQTKTPVFLINGQQFFGEYRGKNAVDAEFPKDYAWLTQRLKGIKNPLLFLSGDIHYTEMMDIEPEILGFSTIEVTSSSMHSLAFPGMHNFWTNPRRRDATSQHNFVVIDFVVSEKQIKGRVKSYGPNESPIFNQPFTVTAP